MFQETTTMNEVLRAKLAHLGWNPDKVVWGRRVNGGMHGVTLERNGATQWHQGPFTPVTARGTDQMAIVRWG